MIWVHTERAKKFINDWSNFIAEQHYDPITGTALAEPRNLDCSTREVFQQSVSKLTNQRCIALESTHLFTFIELPQSRKFPIKKDPVKDPFESFSA
jgi:hypothetical protein